MSRPFVYSFGVGVVGLGVILGALQSRSIVASGAQASFSTSLALTDMRNEKVTSWSLSKEANPASLLDPVDAPVEFHVTATEGNAARLLTESYVLNVTNNGSAAAYFANLVVNLQTKLPKNKFATVASIVADRAAPARSSVPTCFGTYANAPSAQSIQIVDAQSNDVIALNDVPKIQPGETRMFLITTVFDQSVLNLAAGSQIRKEVLVTFEQAGARGGSGDLVSCSIDADGDGTKDDSRTVASRVSVQVPPVQERNASVNLFDVVSDPADPQIVLVSGFAIDGNPSALPADGSTGYGRSIAATGIPGTQTSVTASGAASCNAENADGGNASIVNTATLNGDAPGAIANSPTSAEVSVTCSPQVDPPIQPGDFVTFTQGGWGTKCSGGNPGCVRDANFPSIFPTGLRFGDAAANGAPNGFSALLSTSLSVRNFLPEGGPAAVLIGDLTNPTSTSAGVFGGQLVALILNVEFDGGGILPKLNASVDLKDLVYVNPIDAGDPLNGYAVGQIRTFANTAISGLASPFTPTQLSNAAAKINENFDNGTVNNGYLSLP